ncbi:hypothetical protein J6590_033853 [Homalodisca vitripennis]|nr:hypothetical protein J6590_033853 [Homalodisca vitripennis]
MKVIVRGPDLKNFTRNFVEKIVVLYRYLDSIGIRYRGRSLPSVSMLDPSSVAVVLILHRCGGCSLSVVWRLYPFTGTVVSVLQRYGGCIPPSVWRLKSSTITDIAASIDIDVDPSSIMEVVALYRYAGLSPSVLRRS